MPLLHYDLCWNCQRVPVTFPGEQCEECLKLQAEEQKKIDKQYRSQLSQAQPERRGHRNHKWSGAK